MHHIFCLVVGCLRMVCYEIYLNTRNLATHYLLPPKSTLLNENTCSELLVRFNSKLGVAQNGLESHPGGLTPILMKGFY